MSSRIHVALASLFVSWLCVASAHAQPLPSDPAFVTGELENGLHYVIRQHANPPGRAVIWMHMSTGSLNETDHQRGIAHYLEHMAFNGSKNFPPGSVVPFYQSLGMTFGRDQNAFTNMEQTTFQLSLPDATPETLGKGMMFFSDVLYQLSLTPTEIDAERQIIQEERRRGLSGRQRTSDYILEHIAPGSVYGQRDTIGTEETINGVNEKDFHDYYGKWYTASNATLVVVADADPKDVLPVIKEKFGPAPKRPRPMPQNPGVRAYDKSFALVASDPEIRSEDVRITRLEPARPATTTVPQYRDDLVLRLAEMAINRRMDEKISRGGMSLLSARFGAGNDANTLYSVEASGRAVPGKWHAALEELALELQRARTFGFSKLEVDDARKQIMSGAERAVETEATVSSQSIITRVNGSVTSGDTMLSPSQRLTLLQELLPSITVEEVSRKFAKEFDPKAVAFVAVLPSDGNVPTEAQLLEIGTKALQVKPTQETEGEHATQLMTELPKPGQYAQTEEHAASDVWSGWLSNNARVHYRHMDYRKNEVTVTITLYGGDLAETAANRGITQAAQLAWGRPATQTLSSSDIREIMTGKKINVRGGGGFGGGRGRGGRGGGGGGGSIGLTISGSPEELETGFQLAYLLLTQPKIEEASFTQFKTTMPQMLEEMTKNPMMMGMRLAAAAPYADDEVRVQPPTVEQIEKLTLADAQQWLEKLITQSPIEVAIVGDVDKDTALNLTAKYIGSLTSRDRVSVKTDAALRVAKQPKKPRIIEKTIDTPTDQAFVLSGFYGTDEHNLPDVRALNMAARILSTRMVTEIREKDQLVYSIGASSRPGSTFPGFGVFSASAPTQPTKVDALVHKLQDMYAEFAKSGPSEDEMEVARKQMANTFEEQMKKPGFWMGELAQLNYHGMPLDDVMNAPAAYQALTAQQVKDAFARYYGQQNAIVVVVKPQGKEAADGNAAGK